MSKLKQFFSKYTTDSEITSCPSCSHGLLLSKLNVITSIRCFGFCENCDSLLQFHFKFGQDPVRVRAFAIYMIFNIFAIVTFLGFNDEISMALSGIIFYISLLWIGYKDYYFSELIKSVDVCNSTTSLYSSIGMKLYISLLLKQMSFVSLYMSVGLFFLLVQQNTFLASVVMSVIIFPLVSTVGIFLLGVPMFFLEKRKVKKILESA